MNAVNVPSLHVGSRETMVADLARLYTLPQEVVARRLQVFLNRREGFRLRTGEKQLKPAHRLLNRRADAPFVKGTPRKRVYWVHALYEVGDAYVRVRFHCISGLVLGLILQHMQISLVITARAGRSEKY
jgi:hypothetical protein